MDAKEYLEMSLGGNMNISTLTLEAWVDLMESYSKVKNSENEKSYADGFNDGANHICEMYNIK